MGILLVVLQLVPVIIKLIPLIEEVFKTLSAGTSGLGAIKKQIIMDAVGVSGANGKTVAVVSKLIDSTVSNLNKAGLSAVDEKAVEILLTIKQSA